MTVSPEPALDLDAANEQPAPNPLATPISVQVRPYDPAKAREQVRGWIAVGLTALFIVLVMILAVASVVGYLPADGLEKLAAVLVSPVAGLLGAVTGFYFGEQSRARS